MPTADDVARAALLLHDEIYNTPVLTSQSLNAMFGGTAFMKADIFQRGGAFKARGAMNMALTATATTKYRGIATVTSGNHLQAVAIAAKRVGLPCKIVMPESTPLLKAEAARGHGADIAVLEPFDSQYEAISDQLADDGWLVIPPGEHPLVVAGQGTAMHELLNEVPDIDTLIIQIGGGGLIAGSAIEAAGRNRSIEVIGVEPEGSADTQLSFKSGELVTVEPDTIVDGLRVASPGVATFPIIQSLVSDIVTVSDDDVRNAMRFMFEHMKIVVEPAGAAGVAALMRYADRFANRRVGLLLSGGNISLESFRELLLISQ